MTSLVLHFLIGFPLGLLYANASEWFVHKYLLHGRGKSRSSFWHFHWGDHHQASRRRPPMHDPAYHRGLFRRWDAQTREATSLLVSGLLYLPLFWVVPGFAAAVLYSGLNYYVVHKRSHLDPEWAREHLPWHVDHHLGPNQDANWCVTRPWFDLIMGTREPYVGTEREAEDLRRAAEREHGREPKESAPALPTPA